MTMLTKEETQAHLRLAFQQGTVALISNDPQTKSLRVLAVYDNLSLPINISYEMWEDLGGPSTKTK